MIEPVPDPRRAPLIALDARIAACRACHCLGYLDEAVSIPVVFDPEPDAPVPRILLIGQAPGVKGSVFARPFAGASGDRLRDWFALGGIAPEDFYRKIHFAAVTRCFPGKIPGARGDRVPSPTEQATCRPWQDELVAIVRPEIVLLIGLLAIRTYLGPVPSLTAVVGTATIRDGVRYLPLPHPSGVSRWMNDRVKLEAVGRAMGILRGWVEHIE